MRSDNLKIRYLFANVINNENKMTYIYVMPIHENYNGYGFLENGG